MQKGWLKSDNNIPSSLAICLIDCFSFYDDRQNEWDHKCKGKSERNGTATFCLVKQTKPSTQYEIGKSTLGDIIPQTNHYQSEKRWNDSTNKKP